MYFPPTLNKQLVDKIPAYHHQVSGLAEVTSIPQYDYNSHIEAYLLSKVKIVGPNWYDGRPNDMSYQATIGDYDLDTTTGYGHNPNEAKEDLMNKIGW